MNLSILIPVRNESDNIKGTIRELLDAAAKIPEIDDTKVIVIDDHSEDGTFDVVKGLNDPRVVSLRLSKRGGSHTAIRAGLGEIVSDAVLCIAADGQDDPSCLEEMVRKLRNGAKVVWAVRKNRNNEPWHARTLAKIFYMILSCLYRPACRNIDMSRADFYLLDRIVVDGINRCHERHTSLFSLIIWLGFRQDFVEYERRRRKSGRSKWGFGGKVGVAMDWITAFSDVPLKIASFAGVSISIFGVFSAVLIVVDKIFFGSLITGWRVMIALTLVLSGVQLIVLGVMGEYLWRNLDESRNRPLFFIESRHPSNDKNTKCMT